MRLKKLAALLLAGALLGSTLLSGCGKINQNAVVATYNEQTEVSLGFANFMARYMQATYDKLFLSSYGEGYWKDSSISQDGKTMEESVKQSVMDSIEMYYLLEEHMKDYGVEITEDEKAAIKKAAEQFMEENKKEAIAQIGATEEYVEKMLYYRTVEQKMKEAIQAEVDTKVSEKEAAQTTFSYMKIDLKGYRDEEGNYKEYTDEEIAGAKKTAQAAEAVARKDFDAASEAYKYDILEYSFGSDEKSEAEGGFNEAVRKAVKGMKDGEVSGLIEGTDCYYLVRLDKKFDKEATERKKQEIISQRQNEHYTEVTDKFKKDVKFDVDEKEWEKVNFDDLFTVKQSDSGTGDTGTSEK